LECLNKGIEDRAKGMVFKIPNYKSQISNKLQIPISNDQTDFVSNLSDWDYVENTSFPLVGED
jgi:hypothetical protein